ncbi:hypothetical protein [Lactococcus lactis]|uniref:hypothetical protein n=1 Tax=Lactococcus lactis TaxID=1358 RepID=UPI00071CA884|nr:hypothetical protein [Lactococcus lactis]KST94410.1 hypothetical protein KF146_2196 [Lactococcus lactis subsp. lactis]MDU0397816.1 hypothetical protein [Lactococcus lactis]
MSEIEKNMDAQRLKIKAYLDEKKWTNGTLVRLTGYNKGDVSSIMSGKMYGTPYVNNFITMVCEAYGIK